MKPRILSLRYTQEKQWNTKGGARRRREKEDEKEKEEEGKEEKEEKEEENDQKTNEMNSQVLFKLPEETGPVNGERPVLEYDSSYSRFLPQIF